MKNNTLKLLAIAVAFVPFISFAYASTNSVHIGSVVAHPTGTVDISGTASFDVGSSTLAISPTTSGTVSIDGSSASFTGESWSLTLHDVKLGVHTVKAVVGDAIATAEANLVGDGGGIMYCPPQDLGRCGMPLDWNALMAAQKPAEVPHQMTVAEIQTKIDSLKAQVIELLKEEVQLLIAQLPK